MGSAVASKERCDATRAAELIRRHPPAKRLTALQLPNVRAVGLIAKPSAVESLKAHLGGALMDLLRQLPGFSGAMMLHSREGWRSMIVLTFWETEEQAAGTHWEEIPSVRGLVFPFVDICKKVQTFEGSWCAGDWSGSTKFA